MSSFVDNASTRCGGCHLFLQPETHDPFSCVACRRGGFDCRSVRPSKHEALGIGFRTSLLKALQGVSSKSHRLLGAVTGSPPDTYQALTIASCNTLLPTELQVLSVISEIDQRLESACQTEMGGRGNAWPSSGALTASVKSVKDNERRDKVTLVLLCLHAQQAVDIFRDL